MNKYLSITFSDFKNISRDPTLLLMLLVPFLIIAVVRFGLPFLNGYFPEIENYNMEIIVFFALLNAVFPGFIVSFIFLDEKDLQLFPVIKVSPISLSGFIGIRMVFMIVFGFISSFLMLSLNNAYIFPIIQKVIISMLCALNVPILILLIISIAKNKVEGLTILKIATSSLAIPMLIFFIDSSWTRLLAVFPSYSIYSFVLNQNYIECILGFAYLVFLNYSCFRFAMRKN